MRAIMLGAPLALLAAAAVAQDGTWGHFNGDLAARKFSPLTQITPENVGDLEVAWRTHTGDVWPRSGLAELRGHHAVEDIEPKPGTPPTVWSATPLYVNGTVYLGTPFYRIFALEPDTGVIKWTYDSGGALEALTQPDLKNRGVAYWQAEAPAGACDKRVFIGTMDAKLHAVDADTGERCADFGDAGVVDVDQWNDVDAKWPLSLLQPPTIFEDYVFVGWAGKDWADAVAPPGTVFALDARTGALRWTFRTLTEAEAKLSGTGNVWASMSIDTERRLLYVPVSSPSPNFYGGDRPGPIELATSVTALDVDTGDVVWSRQLVHHDIWDFDTNAPPTLVDLELGGETVPALAQTSKQGFIYVLNRETGEPIHPIEERPVPASDTPGETAAPTQPYVARPEPVIADEWPGIFELADRTSFGYCRRKLAELRYDGKFTPPSLQGSLIYPGTIGGIEWGGGAVDPATGVFVVNYSSAAQIMKLIPRDDYDDAKTAGAETGGFFPMTGAPYGVQLTTFLNPAGIPCWKPPYGSITAYDLRSGERLWDRPFGQVQQWGFYMPESWGSITLGGPAITASGLIFIGASMDSRVRALDLATGEELWRHLVSAPAVAMPAIYEHEGRQYVVFAAGGNSILTPKVSDEIVAFALPGPTAR